MNKSQQMSDVVSFHIMRGRHSHSSAEDIIRLTKDADIICVETLGAFDDVQLILKAANALSSNAKYIEAFANDVEKNINGNLILKVAWAFKGLGKYFLPVDVAYRPTDDVSKFLPFYNAEERLAEIMNKSNDRYALMRQFFQQECEKINFRDHVVAKQIGGMLAANNGFIWKDIVAKKGHCEIAVVQGYVHDVSRYIKKYLPAASIKQTVYNKKSTEDFLRENVASMLLSKQLETPNPEFTNKEIDYYLYQIFSQKHVTPDGLDYIQLVRYVGTKQHEDNYKSKQSTNRLKPIDSFTEIELKELVDKLLYA